MTLPDWFCPVVCSGLDLGELMPKFPPNNKIEMAAKAKKFRFKSLNRLRLRSKSQSKSKAPANSIENNDFEENEAINVNRDMFDDPQENP